MNIKQKMPRRRPRTPQDAQKTAREAPRTPQDALKTTSKRPKRPPRCPEDARKTHPRRPKISSSCHKRAPDAPKKPQDATSCLQDASRRLQTSILVLREFAFAPPICIRVNFSGYLKRSTISLPNTRLRHRFLRAAASAVRPLQYRYRYI